MFTICRTARRPLLPAATTLLVLLAATQLPAIEVTTFADENGTNPAACALREAIRTLNEQTDVGGCRFSPDDSLIELGAGTFTVSLDLGVVDRIPVRRPMTLRGQGSEQTFIEPRAPFDGDLLFVSLLEPGTMQIESLSMRGMRPEFGIFNNPVSFNAESGEVLRLVDVAIRDNVMSSSGLRVQGNDGGAVHLERVVFENNTNLRVNSGAGQGGAILCSSDAELPPSITLRDVTLRNNRVVMLGRFGGNGGGMYIAGCDIDLERVTFEGNQAIGDNEAALGGGLVIDDDGTNVQARLTNVTFFGNGADLGGALFVDQSGGGLVAVELNNVTFARNTATSSGDHVFQAAGNALLRNVVFGPTAGIGCGAVTTLGFTLLGGNLDADGSCGVELFAPDPGLACELELDPGAFTATLPLRPGSAAIDAGVDNGCPAFDQRNVARPLDGDRDNFQQCDIGAYESRGLRMLSDGFERC